MGYTTSFDGAFKLDKALTVSHLTTLKEFAMETHGMECPGTYCQWVPGLDATEIMWDGNPKFYEYTEWLAYLIEKFLEPWGYTLNGEVTWQGEDSGDVGKIVVENNMISAKTGRIVYG